MSQIWGKMTDAAGRAWNLVEHYGARAWAALKSGATGLFSGIDWDAAGLALMEGYDATMRALGATWEWLSAVWDGFAPSLGAIGDSLQSAFGSLGGVWENIKGIGSGLIVLATGIGKLLGLGDGTGEGIAVFLGQFAGGIGQLLGAGVKLAADALQIISGALRLIVDLVNGQTPDWASYFPSWVVESINAIGSAIGVVTDGIKWLWDNDPAGQGTNEPDWTNPETYRAKDPVAAFIAAQQLDKLEAMPAPVKASRDIYNPSHYSPLFASIELVAPPAQRVDVDVNTIKSEITVRYDGPLQGPSVINAATTANVAPDGGLAVGRP